MRAGRPTPKAGGCRRGASCLQASARLTLAPILCPCGAPLAACVRFLPDHQLSELPDHSTLFAAAMRQGLPLAHACPGEGLCGRCGLRILEGREALSAETPHEQKIKADNRVDPALRLACLTRVVGSVTVTADYW